MKAHTQCTHIVQMDLSKEKKNTSDYAMKPAAAARVTTLPLVQGWGETIKMW